MDTWGHEQRWKVHWNGKGRLYGHYSILHEVYGYLLGIYHFGSFQMSPMLGYQIRFCYCLNSVSTVGLEANTDHMDPPQIL